MTAERVIGYLERGGAKVACTEVPGAQGYNFNAVGRESLPLAVHLAHLQAKMVRADKEGYVPISDKDFEEWEAVERSLEALKAGRVEGGRQGGR